MRSGEVKGTGGGKNGERGIGVRGIKFRMWDGQKISQVRPVWFEEMGIYYSDDFQECASELNCILMQFTGLKDKNGREIYEGDILSNGRKNEVVEWSSDDELDNRSCSGFILFTYQHLKEVIGNIYENPDLISK